MRLKDRVAIITGAGQGIGAVIAGRFSQEGAKVVVADIDKKRAEAVVREIKKEYGGEAFSLKVDVTREKDAERMARETVRYFGTIDILVSNAGILIAREITKFSLKDWRRVIDINLIGYFLCARACARVMIKKKSGVIIQINSKSGKRGSFRNSAYASSKFGGVGLTQSLALELAPYNIRVNCVCPGNVLDSPLWVDSLYKQYSRKWGISIKAVRDKYVSQVPLGRPCTYEDINKVVVFLASDESSYMTGQAINVTGGQVMD